MNNPERIIFVPLGDKTHDDLEGAASREAWRLDREIIEKEYLKGRIISISHESLQKLPRVNPIYYLRKGITTMGGFLVKIEELKIPRKI